MRLKTLTLLNFRNYRDLRLEIPPEGVSLYGPNGAGKTNLLEAIHLLCTARSQRGAQKGAMIAADASQAFVEGEFDAGDGALGSRTYSFAFDRSGASILKINDRKIGTISEWFGSRAVVSFSTDDVALVYGSPEERRRFLDMLISQSDREFLDALIEYRKNLALRNRLLKISDDDLLFRVYEERMAEAGAVIVERRREAVGELQKSGADFYREICGGKESISMSYEEGFVAEYLEKTDWKNVFLSMLSERREGDRMTGFSTCGPHRDDIRLLIEERAAKSFASQGQCRSLALSLKLSSVNRLSQSAGTNVIILFDDAVSELDAERCGRVYSLIGNRGQLFIAAPEPATARGIMRKLRIGEGGTLSECAR